MLTDIVFTLTGPDRVGIVEEVTKSLLDLGGNVESGRMARLGGAFAIIMQVKLPPERLEGLDASLAHLTAEGYTVTATPTQPEPAEAHAGWRTYLVGVTGADHEGIVHAIAAGLSERGINIESVETSTTRAPLSGTPLFSMSAVVAVPPDLPEAEWQAELAEAAHLSGVDVTVSAADEE